MNIVDSSGWLAFFAEATIWTQDADFEKIPGVRYFPKR